MASLHGEMLKLAAARIVQAQMANQNMEKEAGIFDFLKSKEDRMMDSYQKMIDMQMRMRQMQQMSQMMGGNQGGYYGGYGPWSAGLPGGPKGKSKAPRGRQISGIRNLLGSFRPNPINDKKMDLFKDYMSGR